MEILKVSDKMLNKIEEFLLKLDTIKNIEKSFLLNGIVILDNDEIKGYMTYEEYVDYGLIRYFVFQKDIEFNYVRTMLKELARNASANEIKSFIALGKTDEIVELFTVLDFYIIDSGNIIINDKRPVEYRSNFGTILKYDII